MLLEKALTIDEVRPQTPTFIDPNAILSDERFSFSDGCLSEGLMEEKYSECTGRFITSLIEDGQTAPVLISRGRGGYYFMNGHHRLAVAAEHGLQLLVMIISSRSDIYDFWDSSESDDFPDSGAY